MKATTQSNVEAAFAGESQAHMKYLNFASRAERDGFPNIARLFRAASLAEQIHASNHLRVLDGIKDTVANLVAAKTGEDFEIAEMYPAYMAVAEMEGEKRALRSMSDAMEAEKVHSAAYGVAQAAATGGKDVEEHAIWVCTTCGFTMEGDAPDVCPVCNTRHEKFQKF